MHYNSQLICKHYSQFVLNLYIICYIIFILTALFCFCYSVRNISTPNRYALMRVKLFSCNYYLHDFNSDFSQKKNYNFYNDISFKILCGLQFCIKLYYSLFSYLDTITEINIFFLLI